MRWLVIFTALFLPATALAVVNVTFNTPTYGFSVLAGSVRVLNVGITGGTGNLVNWTVSGTTGGASATLSASTNAIPVVTATFGATAGTCSITGSLGSYAVTSTATVTIQAQSVDDVSKTASTSVNVCSTAVQIAVVPFYRTLYASQKADLQSFIIGSTNLGVTWSLGACTGSAVGSLADTGNRDTVFSATGTGRCTVTATSSADGSKTASATMNITGNALPAYATTPEFTTPVDCTVDAAATGTTYEVGPARAFTTIQSVPMDTMPAGSTVRIHNDDGTGLSPTTYHEYFMIKSKLGTATQPLRVVGCPDSLGNLPIVDGATSTGASWVSAVSAAGLGVASIAGGVFGYYQAGNPTNNYDIIEGLHIKNARPGNTYTTPSGTAGTAWLSGASCINVRSGYHLVFIGNDLDNCSNGTFSDANMNSNAWAGNVMWSDWEGNHIQNSGESGSFLAHQLYVQGWGQVMQFNRIDNYTSGANGVDIKSRGIGDIIRYNYMVTGGSRVIDLVELQDSSSYEMFEGYLGAPSATNCATSFWCSGPDTMGANILTAWQEAYHQHYIYGNIVNDAPAEYMLHFGEDHDGGMSNRLGTLYFYNNTWNTVITTSSLFDTSGGGGNAYNNYEFPTVSTANNIYWTANSSFPYWNQQATFIGTFQTNLLNTNWGNINTPINAGSVNGHTGSGWSNLTTAFSFPLATPMETHMTGISAGNFLTTSTQPFDSTTYIPASNSAAKGIGTTLTGAMAVMPVRFQMRPDTGVVTARANINDVGALAAAAGVVGATGISNGATLSNGATIQ